MAFVVLKSVQVLRKILKHNTVPLLVMVLLFVGIYIASQFIPEKTIRTVIEWAGPFGPVAIILCILLTNIVAPLSAAPFLYVGFLAYGKETVLLFYVAAVLASVTNYWLAHQYGRNLVEKLAGKEPLGKVDSFTKKYGLLTLILLRLTLSEHDVISYAAGLTKISFIPYFIISVFGMIPRTIFLYFLASKMQTPLDFTIMSVALAWIVVGIFVIFTWAKKALC